jgi:dephospho-CoA kinase
VKAPLDLRINRVMERDHSTETEVKARIALQEQTSKNENLSDFIINNDNLANLELICKDIHYKLTK